MKECYLGDSYDLVKRFWCDCLREIGPLYAHPRFVLANLRERYTALTAIPILDIANLPGDDYGLLLDPDTGIPLRTVAASATNSHAPLSWIVDLAEKLRPKYLICFDQSVHRHIGVTAEKQRAEKMQFLQDRGLSSFYYRSHASFLFAARSPEDLQAVRERLLSWGLPSSRLEPAEGHHGLASGAG